MYRRPHWIAFGAVALLAMVLLNLPDTVAGRIKLTIGGIFLPLFGLVNSGQTLASQGANTVASRQALIREASQLRQLNQELRLQLAQTQVQADENRRLRQLLGWAQAAPWKYRAARVIARDPADWWRSVRLDLGSREGARSGLPVVCADGLIGRIDAVGPSTSEAILIGDPKCRVAVVVRETGEHGVLSSVSAGVLDHRLVDLTHLPRNTALRPGQTVFTSGLGGLFPAGIPVGTVVDVRSVGYGLYTEARVKLGADTSRLHELLVLFP
jgi:rod shape-determining protein MreC